MDLGFQDDTPLCVFKEASERVDGRAHLQCVNCGRMMWRCLAKPEKAVARCQNPGKDSPTFLGMMASAANAAVNFAADGGKMVSVDVRNERQAICNTCPSHDALNRCKDCGCFLVLKTWLPKEKCPRGKWPS
jgi:hypothetical protein